MQHLDPLSVQTLMDAIPAPVFFKGGHERYLGCNLAFENAIGTPREQLVGRTSYDIAPPQLAEIYHQKDQELLRNPGTQVYEASLRYADGTLHEVVFNKATFLDEAGAIGGLIGVILDITERKRTESRLAETLEMVRKMVAATPAGIAVYEAETGQCVLCNPAMASLAGGEIQDIEKLNFRDLEPWRESGLLEAAERALATGEDQRLETHLVSSFGRPVWISCVFTAFTSAGREHLLMLANDVTSRRVAEEAMARGELQYRALTEKMGEGLLSTDPAGTINYCNPRFLQMLGLRREEALGRTFFEMAHGYSHEKFLERLGDRRRGQPEQYEIQLHHKGGYGVDVLVSAEPLFGPRNEFTGTLGIITDIRERKLREETLRRAHKVESLMTMAGGIAHDFNNLFQTIQGSLEMAQLALADPARARRALDRALQSLEQAKLLSQRMLDYSGKGPSQSLPIDLAELVRQHAGLFSSLVGPETQLICRIEDGLPPIEGDPGQLSQVLTALVTNAKEALDGPGGSVTLRLEAASGDLQTGGDWVESPPEAGALLLSVSDTGHGIAKEMVGRLFDPFFTTKETGRGLGLAAALGILRAHRAGLQVQSRPGAGSLFRIAFPALERKPEVSPPSPPAPAGGPPCDTVLLVDDDPGVRATGAEILADFLHYRVLTARDGREAVEVFREHADIIAVILMDATMPLMSGGETFRAIQAVRPTARAILCSGYSDETGQQLVEEYGFAGFLKKPYSIQHLQALLEKTIPPEGPGP